MRNYDNGIFILGRRFNNAFYKRPKKFFIYNDRVFELVDRRKGVFVYKFDNRKVKPKAFKRLEAPK